ncbi:MAG: pyrroline-5-carboxylate reductase [SAR324 cluster bacterium]|nr:pyrroline-5-carboxylate reductase [SAR324 cluster bacterium]
MSIEYAFIGGGNMGQALAAALIGRDVCRPEAILVVDPDAGCREKNEKMGCLVAEFAGEAVGEASVVVLAVKPQNAQVMFGQAAGLLKSGQVVVSIMAGVTIAAMTEGLRHNALVRVMPNTPAQVGMGMNVYYAVPSVSADQLRAVEALLNASGEALAVFSEDAIDAATAISGSGPAYVFYVAEHWMKKAEALGFSAQEAQRLVQQTLLGATTLWKAQDLPVSVLREQVTSKGGTTAAALESFESNGLGAHIQEGIERAYRRAKELGS